LESREERFAMQISSSVLAGALVAQISSVAQAESTSLWLWVALAAMLVAASAGGLFAAARALRRRLVPVKVRKQ